MLSRFCPESDNDIPEMTLDPVGGNYELARARRELPDRPSEIRFRSWV
jgi:hypothetical protein